MNAVKKIAKKSLDDKLLKKFIPLNTLSSDKLRELNNKAVMEQFGSGRTLFKVGDNDQKTYFLIAGEVEIIPTQGVPQILRPDSPQALYALSNARPRLATAQTKAPCTLLVLDTGLLDLLLSDIRGQHYEVNDIHAENQDDWMTRFVQSLATMNVPVKNIEMLMRRMEEITLHAGEPVMRQSENGEHYYLVKEGRCVVTKQASPGKTPIRIAELGEGTGFGEEALIANQTRNATITMLSDGRLMRLSKSDFLKLIAEPALRLVPFADAAKMIEAGAVFIDVRSEAEYRANGVRNAVNIPLPVLRLKTKELNIYGKYIVYCDTGSRSTTATFLLRQHGYDACILDQGMTQIPESLKNSRAESLQPIISAGIPSIDVRYAPPNVISPPPRTPPALKVALVAAETRLETVRVQELANPNAESLRLEKRLKEAETILEAVQVQLHNASQNEQQLTLRLAKEQTDHGKQLQMAKKEIAQLLERTSLLDRTHMEAEQNIARLKMELDATHGKTQNELRHIAELAATKTAEEIALHKEEVLAARRNVDDYAHRAQQAETAQRQIHNELQQIKSDYEVLANDADAKVVEIESLKQQMQRETDHRILAEQAQRNAEREAARFKSEADAARAKAEELAHRAEETTALHNKMLQELMRKIEAAELIRLEAEHQATQLRAAADASRRKSEEETRKYAQAETARLKAMEESERRTRSLEEMRRKTEEESAQLKSEVETARASAIEARKKSVAMETARRQMEEATKRQAETLAQKKVIHEEEGMDDLEKELAKIQEKLEQKKRSAMHRKQEIKENAQNREPEIAQNVYNLHEHQKTQQIKPTKPTDTLASNVGKIQKSGWISDAMLWDTTLGLRSDSQAEEYLTGKESSSEKRISGSQERFTSSVDLRDSGQKHTVFTSRDFDPEISAKKAEMMQKRNVRVPAVRKSSIIGGLVLVALASGLGTYAYMGTSVKHEQDNNVSAKKTGVPQNPAIEIPTSNLSGEISRLPAEESEPMLSNAPTATTTNTSAPRPQPAMAKDQSETRAKEVSKGSLEKKTTNSAAVQNKESSPALAQDRITTRPAEKSPPATSSGDTLSITPSPMPEKIQPAAASSVPISAANEASSDNPSPAESPKNSAPMEPQAEIPPGQNAADNMEATPPIEAP